MYDKFFIVVITAVFTH